MSIEIIPQGASAVITDKRGHDHDGDRYRNHDRFAQVERDIKDSRYDVVEEMTKGFTAEALASTNSDRINSSQMNAGFTAAALASCKTEDQIQESADKVMSDVRHSSEKNDDNFSQLQKQVSDSATSTLVGFKDQLALTYQVEGRSLLEAAKNANALAVQSDKNWASLQFQAEKNASASVLLAQQLASDAARQAAECCCELKELIRADGDRTRALINGHEIDRLRDRAAKAEAGLAAYFAAKVAPTVPVV